MQTAASGTAAADDRFFARTGPHSLADVAAMAGAHIAAAADGAAPNLDLMLHGVAPLQSAGPAHVSFLDNRRYLDALTVTRAGAVIVHPELVSRVPAGSVAIEATDPYSAWARVAGLFHPPPPVRAGVHPSAVVAGDAVVDPSAEIGPLAVIGAGAVIGDAVSMGADCRIGPLASVSHAMLGARVYVYPGARIGQEGFGFATIPSGFLTVPQLGRVLLEDDVEVGANSTIDRGSATDTVIGAGSRLDNLVQIGHNVRMGRCCIVVAQAGISGSTVLEDFVVIAAQAGLTGHLNIGRKARIGAQAGVMSDVGPGLDVIGSPSQPSREFFRGVVTLRRLSRPSRPNNGLKPSGQKLGEPTGEGSG